MSPKAAVRNEHIEAFLAERFEEIPEDLMPQVKERVSAMLEATGGTKPKKPLKLVKADDKDLPDNFA